MLEECLAVFEKVLNKKGEKLILNKYIPAEGSYIIVDRDGKVKDVIDIKMDKKTREIVDKSSEYYIDIILYDYYSKLLSMNKPIDSKKVIHSNNYLSFFVKKENVKNGKLTEAIIDNYYNILANPLDNKYKKSKEASRIYQEFVKSNGKPDEEVLNKNMKWIKEHIFKLEEIIPATKSIDMTKKDYLKIFFEADKEDYEKESNRYILPNIYNCNDYNIEVNGKILGLADNNISMNSKKPFLGHKNKKVVAPYLIDGQRAIIQKKFFEYLMNMASLGKYNIYINTEKNRIEGYSDGEPVDSMECGYFLHIAKGTELEIVTQDNISGYEKKLSEDFILEHVLNIEYKYHPEYEDFYKRYDYRYQIADVLNDILFFKLLKSNYYTSPNDLRINDTVIKQNILTYRNMIFDWVYKGFNNGFIDRIETCCKNIIKNSILNDYKERAILQLDLYYSLRIYFKGEKNMSEIISDLRNSVKDKVLSKDVVNLSNDKEYYYAIGQLAGYLISRNKSGNKAQSLINPFLNATSDVLLKARLKQLYKKYNYDISENSRRIKNLVTLIWGYEAKKVDEDMILLGYADNNIMFTKNDNE